MAKGFAPGFRFWFLSLLILVGYGAIGYRLVDLHALKRESLVKELHRHRYRIIPSNPRRGDIYDSGMELLATSHSFVNVGLDPTLIKESDIIKLAPLSEILQMPLSDIEEAFGVKNGKFVVDPKTHTRRWIPLARHSSETAYEKVKALGIRCVYGNREYSRVYPKDELAAHVVGFSRKDGQAVMGVEKTFDFYLSGQKGWKESEVKAGIEMAQFRTRLVPAEDGMNIVLSIDSYVQYLVEKELALIAEELKPKSASIIISDPHTGFIIGMGNYPTFDPNNYARYPINTHKNRALTDPLEPGSTFKIVAAAGALEEQLVRTWTEFDCSKNTVQLASGYVARLPKDSHENGILSVEEIVSESSNRGAAFLGVLMGENKFYDYVKGFGFGDPTGFSIGQESWGILNPVKRWDGLTLTRMTMGHSISATPIQIHYAMASIANGGLLMRPQVVKSILDDKGDTAIEFGPLPKRRVVSANTANTVARMLEKTVSEGTATSAEIAGYSIAGKTGTSQKLINGRYSSRHHVGSFSGFLPADDPRLVITVIVDDADIKGISYGSRVAAPTFKELAKSLIPYYAIQPAIRTEEIASSMELGPVDWGN
ncbi:penicillin-binding protein 2 [Puniceicoccaceae bacterium K14]|nr:penicillin-binding protein 2 [Puniceicoccaceae bacterium K14]